MSVRIWDLPDGVSQSDPWPYTRYPAQKYGSGAWTLLMDAGGSMTLWPTDEAYPEGTIPVYRTDDKKGLRDFFTVFCKSGYTDSELDYPYQDGWHVIFNWVSGTVSQVAIASQVAHNFLEGRRKEALAIGQAFEDQIRAAVPALRDIELPLT